MDPLFEDSGNVSGFSVALILSRFLGGVNRRFSACAHQALRVGRRARQFHVEVDEPTIREWIEAGGMGWRFSRPAVTSDEFSAKCRSRSGLSGPSPQIYETSGDSFLTGRFRARGACSLRYLHLL
jgi:hypothetical protein